MTKPNWGNDCQENITGYHEISIKWELPDRICFYCKHCGREEIIFKTND